MKNLVLSLLVFVLFLVASITQSHGQILVTSITQNQRSYYLNPSNNQEGGFFFNLDAGGSSPGVGEFGLNSPYVLAQTVDVGEWNWNTPYNFLFSNDGGGGYQVTVSQGSSIFQTAVFRPTVPYTDLMFSINNVSYPSGGGLEFNNIAIGGQAIGSLDAGPNDPTPRFTGVLVSGAGSTWNQITGTVIPMADIIAPPNFNDFQLDIIGLVPQPGDVPEPSSWALLLVGAGILVCYGRTRRRKNDAIIADLFLHNSPDKKP